LVKVLEGPSDVEWCCFHPKGGTVSYHLMVLILSCFDVYLFMLYLYEVGFEVNIMTCVLIERCAHGYRPND
jgi:hypothetical protein